MINEGSDHNSINSRIKQTDDGNVNEIVEKLRNAFVDDETEHRLNSHIEASQSHSGKRNRYDEFQSHSSCELYDMNHLFHIDFMQPIQSTPAQQKRFKNGTRISCTFTNEKMRQIEHENKILLNKIMAQRPNHNVKRTPNNCNSEHYSRSRSRATSAINRRQQQERIDFDNQILKKKIEKISQRNPRSGSWSK